MLGGGGGCGGGGGRWGVEHLSEGNTSNFDRLGSLDTKATLRKHAYSNILKILPPKKKKKKKK